METKPKHAVQTHKGRSLIYNRAIRDNKRSSITASTRSTTSSPVRSDGWTTSVSGKGSSRLITAMIIKNYLEQNYKWTTPYITLVATIIITIGIF